MTLEEMIAWEKEESQSPCYLRSPPLKPKNPFKEFKGNVLLDDFEDIEGEGEGLGSSSSNFLVSHRSDEIRYDVYFEGCFFMCPLDYQDGHILDLRLPRSNRLSYKEINDLLLDKTKEEIWKLFYCKPKCTLEKGLTIVESDRDIEKIFELANLQGALDVYVCHGKVLLDDFESVEFRKGKVLLDDFEAMGNGKDKVDGDDAKDELISTKRDAPSRLSNSSNTSFFLSQEMDYVDEKLTRILNGGTTLEFINDGGETEGGYFGDIKSYIKNGKLEKVVAIITSCKPNVLGDMNVTLKDPLGVMSGTIHYKVLSSEDGYINDIKVGSALILHNVSVFCPKSSNCALNITLKNLVNEEY
ncbi:transposase, MuDR, MULE transposase domain protein [Tanacetum coccineum]